MVRPRSAVGEGGAQFGLRRRDVLRGLGTGALAGVGLVGTASGHSVQGQPVFCGCSQLCVCINGHGGILMAQETDDGYDVGFLRDGELVPYPDGESPYSGNFCVSAGEDNVPDGKIIGLQVAGTRWVNPNQCAQKALEAEQEQLDSTHERPPGDSGGPCGKPPCEHPSGGNGNGSDGDEVTIRFEDCETVTLTGPDDDLERIEIHLMRCFDDSRGCPDGDVLTRNDPDLPLTLGREELAVGNEQYLIDRVDMFGEEGALSGTAEPPEDLDCTFDSVNDSWNIDFEMADQTITLTEEEDAVSEVTITGTAEFGYAGWGDDGPVDHAFISAWAQSEDIDTGGATNSDAERYFDVDGDTDIVRNDVEITFDVPPEVGDPGAGEAIETDILGIVFVGLERGDDPETSQNIMDARDSDPMVLRIEREGTTEQLSGSSVSILRSR